MPKRRQGYDRRDRAAPYDERDYARYDKPRLALSPTGAFSWQLIVPILAVLSLLWYAAQLTFQVTQLRADQEILKATAKVNAAGIAQSNTEIITLAQHQIQIEAQIQSNGTVAAIYRQYDDIFRALLWEKAMGTPFPVTATFSPAVGGPTSAPAIGK